MKTALRLTCITISLLVPVAFMAGQPNEAFPHSGHRSGLAATVTLQNGTVRTVKLEGAGCKAAICSRVAIRARNGAAQLATAWLDDLAAIRDTDSGHATFVGKDGSARRFELISGFRVLYLSRDDGGTEQLDIAQVRSLDFATSAQAVYDTLSEPRTLGERWR